MAKSKVTQRDVAESVVGLRGVASDLREAAAEVAPEGAPPGTVLINARALTAHANYLDEVADELLTLIPEKKVVLPE